LVYKFIEKIYITSSNTEHLKGPSWSWPYGRWI